MACYPIGLCPVPWHQPWQPCSQAVRCKVVMDTEWRRSAGKDTQGTMDEEDRSIERESQGDGGEGCHTAPCTLHYQHKSPVRGKVLCA